MSGTRKVARLARLAMVAGIEVKPTCPDAAAPNQAMPTASTENSRLIASIQRLRKPSLNSLRAILKICFIVELLPRLQHRLFPCNNSRGLPARAGVLPDPAVAPATTG